MMYVLSFGEVQKLTTEEYIELLQDGSVGSLKDSYGKPVCVVDVCLRDWSEDDFREELESLSEWKEETETHLVYVLPRATKFVAIVLCKDAKLTQKSSRLKSLASAIKWARTRVAARNYSRSTP